MNMFPALVLTIALAGSGAALAQEDVILPFADIAFAAEAPDQPQTLGALWGDRAEGPAGTYLRVPGGWEAPLHTHTAAYRAVVVQGVWTHWVPGTGQGEGIELPTGSYWTQAADQPHRDACRSEETCVVLLINDAPYRTELAE